LTELLRNRLRLARADRGWTQAELAERVGVTRKTVNTVENGVFVPSTVLALKLARAMGMTVEELFELPPGS
jgi:putative transcriptional regulator